MAARQGGCREEGSGVANLEDNFEERTDEHQHALQGSNLVRKALLPTRRTHTIIKLPPVSLPSCMQQHDECAPRGRSSCCRIAASVAAMQHPFLSTLEAPLVPHGRRCELEEADEGARPAVRNLPDVYKERSRRL